MKWSWKIARIAGISVFIHATFVMLLVWVALSGYFRTGKIDEAIAGLGFTLALFGVVVLHELGHALTARRFGIKTRDITLLPIGGVARLERMPEEPRQELLVALAGPAVNVALAVAIYAAARAAGADIAAPTDLASSVPLWTRLFWVNVVLAAFNLLPAFPMDGGRALRAVLAMRMDHVRATQIAARFGQAAALGMGLLGFFFNPFLMFVALFVWIGAAAEAGAVAAKSAMENLPVRAAMQTRFATLEPTDTLGDAARQLLAGSDVDFPVVLDGRVIGVLMRNDLVLGLASRGPEVPVGAVMQRRVQTVDPSEMLDKALERLESSACRVLPVVRNGALVGLVTPENVAELLMLRRVLAPPRKAPGLRPAKLAWRSGAARSRGDHGPAEPVWPPPAA